MNTKILQKCLDELGKTEPNLSYIRGMLETIIDMGNSNQQVYPSQPIQFTPSLNALNNNGTSNKENTEEDSPILSQYLGGSIGAIQ